MIFNKQNSKFGVLKNARMAPKKFLLPCKFLNRLDNLGTVINNLSIRSNIKAFALIGSIVKNVRQIIINECKSTGVIFDDKQYKFHVNVSCGVRYKRYMCRAKGSSNEILKRTTHISVYIKHIEVKDGK